MVKLALGMIVFNGMPFVEGVLKTWYPYVDQIVVAEGPVKFWQEKSHTIQSMDGTVEALRDFPDPENKVSVIPGYSYLGGWRDKLDMCNTWLGRVRDDITHVLCMDADEFMLKEDIEWLIAMVQEMDLDSAGFRLYSFVGGLDRYMTGFEERLEVVRLQRYYPEATWKTHRPPTIINPATDVSWRESGRHLNYDTAQANGVRLYHYSHVIPSQVLAKEQYYANYLGTGNVIADYYGRVWRPWVLGDDKRKRAIENLWNGIHDFHPRYRGEAFSKPFTGRHPQWIEDNRDRIMEIQRRQMEERC